jgi:protein-L-isoaspartate(D-aspartate) O-methyltransferase
MIRQEVNGMLDFARARRNMVDSQLRTFDVTDRAVLAAMGESPRERFVPETRLAFAYLDQNVSLRDGAGEPRWMLQPMVIARIIQALEVMPGSRILDVGAGYGYASDIFARLGASVVALESDEGLATQARARVAAAQPPVEVRVGPLAEGCPDRAPFDIILVNGAIEKRPEKLLRQLTDGGRLACLGRDGAAGHALLYVKAGDGFGLRRLFDASAPLMPAFLSEPVFEF